MILDGTTVWTGSWNYSQSSTFNNNENALVIDSPQLASYYQAEFNQMFDGKFGPHKEPLEQQKITIGDGTAAVYFAPEDDIPPILISILSSAQSSIRLMAFSFTLDDYRDAILAAMQRGVNFQGIIEKRGWDIGEFPQLFCAGADARTDANKYFLHHDVIVIDDSLVITGSLNFSSNASESNDENILIVDDKALATAYNQEFDRLWATAEKPTDQTCITPTP